MNTMTAVKKPTKRELFNRLLTLSEVKVDTELTQFIKHELELLDKKSASGHKPTKNQEENEVLMAGILDGMEENRNYLVVEIQKEIPCAADLSCQKLTALLTKLVKANQLTRSMEKRKSVYCVVSSSEEETAEEVEE